MANLLETASTAGEFSTLLQAIDLAELAPTLNAEGSYTLLAPTDAAFAKLPAADRDALLENIPKLKRVLLYHVIPGDVRAEDLIEIDEAPTAEGSIVAIQHSPDRIRVNDAIVTSIDTIADNGVIHAIDTVLMPGILEGEYN
jgi:uncharacterized surface protein with fasciclin (FAS1) repeats